MALFQAAGPVVALRSPRGVAGLVLAVSAAALFGSAGCADNGAMTCADYGQKDYNERGAVVREMIRDHGLDPQSSAMGAAKVGSDVDAFCGTLSFPGTIRPATKNSTQSIENGVAWSAYTR